MPVLTGVGLRHDHEASTLTLSATDRYRYAVRTRPWETPPSPTPVRPSPPRHPRRRQGRRRRCHRRPRPPLAQRPVRPARRAAHHHHPRPGRRAAEVRLAVPHRVRPKGPVPAVLDPREPLSGRFMGR
ncbi:hypothetical protein ACWGN5_40115 [Streptomyces sp. NPDC055815]